MSIYNATYAIDSGFMTRARKREISMDELRRLKPAFTCELDSEEAVRGKIPEAVAAIGEAEHVCVYTSFETGLEIWNFWTFGDEGYPFLITNADLDENDHIRMRQAFDEKR